MTPYRGIGANTALRDAAALRQALRAVDRAENDLIPALAAYASGRWWTMDFRQCASHRETWNASMRTRAFTKLLFRTSPLPPSLANMFTIVPDRRF
jgi:2-polyprenyl-6-methoxyphenol hydroxylase-like FAD-dependent oxidoreductase